MDLCLGLVDSESRLCEGQSALAVAEVDGVDRALVAEVFDGVVVEVEVVFADDSERTDDQLALLATRQVEVARQAVPRIVVVPVPVVVHALGAVLPPVTVARVILADRSRLREWAIA
jgi:hypothetical protein